MAVAKGLEILSQQLGKGQFDEVCQKQFPTLYSLLKSRPGSPEYCTAFGKMLGSDLFQVLVIVGTEGLGEAVETLSAALQGEKTAATIAELTKAANVEGSPFLEIKTPKGKFGSGNFGMEAHQSIADAL